MESENKICPERLNYSDSHRGHSFTTSRRGGRVIVGNATSARQNLPPHHLTPTSTSTAPLCIPPMPKVVTPWRANAAKGVLVDGAIKFKERNRTRNKAGRAVATNVKNTLELPPPKPAPLPLPVLPDQHPRDPESDNEEEIQLPTQKGPSRAVSVSPMPLAMSIPADSSAD